MNGSFYRNVAAVGLLLGLCLSAAKGFAQQADSLQQAIDTEADSVTMPDDALHHKAKLRPYGRFNYTYIRIAKLFPGAGFANPVAGGFAGSEHFTNYEAATFPYTLGFESGNVRHFMKLRLGTEMLKLAINSGIALQAYGSSNEQRDNAVVTNGGVYLVRLGLGPQVTFKPIADIRIGVYYRAGIAALYSDYTNEQTTAPAADVTRKDRVNATLLNYNYNGELGFDCSWHALNLGLSYAMLSCRASSGVLFSSEDKTTRNVYTSVTTRNGVQEGATVTTPIDPAIKFNRFSVSVGFSF